MTEDHYPKIKIHVLHTGMVHVSPALPNGGKHCSLLKASGLLLPYDERIWIPVSVYYIEHSKGKILIDTGWNREMSPNGTFDKKAQIKSLHSDLLYHVNQGVVPEGMAVNEQLRALGVCPEDLDYVLMTHLDCDHANGLSQVKNAKKILVSKEELKAGSNPFNPRYHKEWWDEVDLKTFDWNGAEGPFGKSYDLFGDGSIELIKIPGHSAGLFAVKIKNKDGKYVLIDSDGAYSPRNWNEMLDPGIAVNRKEQEKSLEWIREQSNDENCVASLANHDPNIHPQIIVL